MAIGNYIHLNYENYLRYGLNTVESGKEHSVTESDIQKIFEEQTEAAYQSFKRRKQRAVYNVKDIEKQLNFYYTAQRGNNMIGEKIETDISSEDLKYMHEEIHQFLGPKMNKVSIDYNKLSSSLIQGDFNAGVLEAKGKYQEDLLSQLKNIGGELGKSGFANRESVEKRVNLLIKIRERLAQEDPANSKVLRRNLKALETEWNALKKLLDGYKKNSHKRLDLSKSRYSQFVNNLNEILSSFLTGSSTLHGEYAEAVVVGMNYLANAKAIQGTGEILSGLPQALRQGVKGQSRSASGLLGVNFSSDFVDLKQVVDNSVYDSVKMTDSAGNVFSTKITQDKVDVEILIDGLKVPASVKNYNMANVKTDIHLLSGRSVLALVQEYDDFLNHYLNIVAEHSQKEPAAQLLDKAAIAMKLTVLLKALSGAVISRSKDGSIGFSPQADLFIVNDNSVGKFRVYLIEEILDAVQKNIEWLKTGDLDNVQKLKNDYIGTKGQLNMGDAKVRISNLLAQLHQMELQVSISKAALS